MKKIVRYFYEKLYIVDQSINQLTRLTWSQSRCAELDHVSKTTRPTQNRLPVTITIKTNKRVIF